MPTREQMTAHRRPAGPVASGGSPVASGVFLYSGSALISSGPTLTGSVVGASETEYVDGGVAIGTTITAGGAQFVNAGGHDIGALIGSDGRQFVGSGGVSDGAVIGNGGTQILSTYAAVAHDATVQAGGVQDVFLGSATGTTVQAGGLLNLGGAAAGAILAGGMAVVSGGAASGTTILSGSTLTLDTFGQSTSTLISAGGTEIIDYLASAQGTVILAGGVQVVGAGGIGAGFGSRIGDAADTIVSSGGVQIVPGGFDGFYSYGGNATGTVVLSGGTQDLTGGSASGTVLSAGGTIDLGGFAYASGADVQLNAGSDLLSVSAGGSTEQLLLGGSYAGEYFHVSDDGAGGTDVTLDGTPCYCPGTLIATDSGDIAIENLRIGDRLRTLSGQVRALRWIGRRSYDGRFASGNPAVLPVCFRAGVLGDGLPRRDLHVSPLHALFLDGVLIPAWLLIDGVGVVQAQSAARVDYLHLELDSHDVILAEGAAAETYVDDSNRGMFHNAAAFGTLYPHHRPGPALYCAPRVEDGEILQAVRRRLAGASPPASRGALRGHIDTAAHDRIAGWVADQGEGAVRLRLSANGVPLGEILADGHRGDVPGADQRCGFDWPIPGGLAANRRHRLRVQRSADGSDMPGSPCTLPAISATAAGPLRGQIDQVDHAQVLGWADDTDGPVALIVLVDGRRRGRVLANRWRADVAQAGIGGGHRAFGFRFVPALSPRRQHWVEVRRERDGAILAGAAMVTADRSFWHLARAVRSSYAAITDPDERTQAASFLRDVAARDRAL